MGPLMSALRAKLKRVKRFEQVTVLASLAGIALSLVHGNLYDYFFNIFSLDQIGFNLRLLYLSLLLYSALAFTIFAALYLHNEQNPDVRWYNYVQGWAFIVIAASSYEWLYSTVMQITVALASGAVVEDPYTWLTKRYSVIFFGALFVFWLLETRKKRFSNQKAGTLEKSS
jgi:hypothetical protein